MIPLHQFAHLRPHVCLPSDLSKKPLTHNLIRVGHAVIDGIHSMKKCLIFVIFGVKYNYQKSSNIDFGAYNQPIFALKLSKKV